MRRPGLILLALCWTAATAWSADPSPTLKFRSPNGRYALRITEPGGEETAARKIELIEKASGQVVIDLGVAYRAHLSETVLVWSADSKRLAYGTRGDKRGETSVYFWTGAAFEEVPLPNDLPDPKIDFGKVAGGGVKNYGGAVAPVRWFKSGELELSSDSMMMSRVNDRAYTGVLRFTVSFDGLRHASVRRIGKTKTVSE